MPSHSAAQTIPASVPQPVIADVSDLLVHYLEALGIEYVFGIPGGAVEPIFNALARSARRGGPQIVLARHESGAAFMADGYARETGRPGVCIATSGPGATNMITGVATAYDNNVPMLAITGQPPLPAFGRRPLQESACTGIDVPAMFAHCTRYNTLISHPEQAQPKIVAALLNTCHTRQPSHIALPVDVQRGGVKPDLAHIRLAGLTRRPALVDEGAVQLLGEHLRQAARPVLVIGSGCTHAMPPLLDLAQRLDADLVTTPDAKGLINPLHPRYHGVFGFAGHTNAHRLLNEHTGVVLAIGVGVSEWTSGGWSRALLNDRLVHIDDQPYHLLGTPMAQQHLLGDIPAILQRLLQIIEPRVTSIQEPLARIGDAGRTLTPVTDAPRDPASPVSPSALMRYLSRHCPPNVRVVADTGNSTAWAVHRLEIADRRAPHLQLQGHSLVQDIRQRPRNWLQVVMNFAPMGWAIGSAIGLALADRRRPVVCITGDGSYLMNGQEIGVAQSEGLNILYIVLNDSALGMVRHGQRLAGAESIGNQLPPADFAAMARALGVRAYTIASMAELAQFDLAAAMQQFGPCLIDVRLDPEEVPPIASRIAVLGGQQ